MNEVTLDLRWGDLDAQGHINNVTYLELLQEARVAFLTRHGLGMLDDGIIVRAHQVEYVAQVADISIPVMIDVHVEDVRGTSFVFVYTMRHDGVVVLRARTTCAAYDFAHHELRRLSTQEREALESAVATSEQLRDVPQPPLNGFGYLDTLQVRWSDQDWYRHVNNVEFYGYFQEARIRFSVAADPSTARSGQDASAERIWLVARQDVTYLGQMFFRAEPYHVRHAVTKLGTTSVTFVAEIVDSEAPDAAVLARQTSVLVCATPEGPTALSEEFRTRMQPYLLPGQGN